jgi:acetyltransferase-like isoleucine patch superfamily enzyme
MRNFFKLYYFNPLRKLIYPVLAKGETTKFLKKLGESSVLPEGAIVFNPQYISIGKNFKALHNLRIEAWDNYNGQKFYPEIVIGDNVCMNSDIHLGCIDRIIIGSDVLLASRIYISDHSHGEITSSAILLPPVKRPLVSKGPVIIGNGVWIGEGVCILPGVTIGERSIIGANAVVTQSFPPGSVIGGVPARLIKSLL